MIEDAMWLLAVNPTSGRGKGERVSREVADFLSSRGIEYRIVTGANPIVFQENLRREVRNLIYAAKVIAAIGGDGLIHMTLQVAIESKLPMVTIPAGTGNDFARTLGWNPDRPLDPLWAAINQDFKAIDVGLIDGEYFGAIASTGFDSLVNERANRMKWPKGPAKYNVAMAIELPRFQPKRYRFALDGRDFEREAMLIAIGNGRSYGGGMLVCPDADINDGLLDLMILNPLSKREFIRMFPSVYEGKHVEHPKVEILRGREIQIEANAVVYADGERIGPLPANITVANGALNTWMA